MQPWPGTERSNGNYDQQNRNQHSSSAENATSVAEVAKPVAATAVAGFLVAGATGIASTLYFIVINPPPPFPWKEKIFGLQYTRFNSGKGIENPNKNPTQCNSRSCFAEGKGEALNEFGKNQVHVMRKIQKLW